MREQCRVRCFAEVIALSLSGRACLEHISLFLFLEKKRVIVVVPAGLERDDEKRLSRLSKNMMILCWLCLVTI